MKKLVITLLAIVGVVISLVGVAAYNDNAENSLAELTGKTVEELRELKQGGMRWGQIANDAGQLEAFKDAMFSNMKERLDQLVEDGTLTAQQAEDRLNLMQERHEACTGEPNEDGLRVQQGMGQGMGQGMRRRTN